jgi:hypothetical protein
LRGNGSLYAERAVSAAAVDSGELTVFGCRKKSSHR